MKLKKKRELNPDKFRTTLYLDRDLVSYAKEKLLNVSGLLNAVLKRVRLNVPNDVDINSLNLDVILKKEANAEASGENRTRDFVLTKDALGSDSKMEPELSLSKKEGLKISTPSGKQNKPKKMGLEGIPYTELPLTKFPVEELPSYGLQAPAGRRDVGLDFVSAGYPCVDIPTYYRDERVRKSFLDYLDKRGVAGGRNGRRTRYDNALLALAPVYSPDDRTNYDEINDGNNPSQMAHNAMGQFFHWAVDVLGLVTYNGYPISEWNKDGYPFGGIKDPETAMSGRFYNLDTSGVTAALYKLPLDTRKFYLLMAYSGARAAQLYKLLAGTDSKGERYPRRVPICNANPADGIKQTVIGLDARKMSHGKKAAFFYMFPPECEDLVKNYTPEATYDKIMKDLNELTRFERLTDTGDKELCACNANSIRKWGAAVLLKYRDSNGQKISTDDINIIQGRVGDEDVLQANYSPKLTMGAAAYSEVVDVFRAALPISSLDFPDVAPNERERPKPASTEKPMPARFSPNKSQTRVTPEIRDQIIALYQNGTSERKIMTMVKMQRNTISNVLVDAGLKPGSKR